MPANVFLRFFIVSSESSSWPLLFCCAAAGAPVEDATTEPWRLRFALAGCWPDWWLLVTLLSETVQHTENRNNKKKIASVYIQWTRWDFIVYFRAIRLSQTTFSRRTNSVDYFRRLKEKRLINRLFFNQSNYETEIDYEKKKSNCPSFITQRISSRRNGRRLFFILRDARWRLSAHVSQNLCLKRKANIHSCYSKGLLKKKKTDIAFPVMRERFCCIFGNTSSNRVDHVIKHIYLYIYISFYNEISRRCTCIFMHL